MQFIDLISSIDPKLTQDEIKVSLSALKSDPIIWQGVDLLSSNTSIIELLRTQSRGLNPGSLASAVILSQNPDFGSSQGRKNPATLERLLLSYENYIQDPSKGLDFNRAAELAAVLMEKFRVSQKWATIFAEIINRMNLKDPVTLVKIWGTIFGILVNLVEEKDELFSAILNPQNPQIGVDLFNHALMCLAVNRSAKIDILQKHLENQKPAFQTQVLRKLKPLVDSELLRDVAQRLFEKYQTVDVQSQSASEYWNNLESSMMFALNLQSIAEIAAFAQDEENARKMNRKSLEVLGAVTAVSQIREAELQGKSESKLVLNTDLSPEIARELMYADVDVELRDNDKAEELISLIQRAKRIHAGGNDELAKKEIRDVWSTLTDDEISQFVIKGSRFATKWDPMEIVSLFVQMGCGKEALRLVHLLLGQRPTDQKLTQIAFELSIEDGNDEETLTHAKMLYDISPEDPGIKRSLSRAYAKTADYQNALQISKTLVDEEGNGSADDQLMVADYCLKLGSNEKALELLRSILKNNPEDAKALTLAGVALSNLGDSENSMRYLERAVQLAGDDPAAWMLLSDLYWRNGNKEASIQKLKEGMAATPGQAQLEIAYARRLIELGAVADAFPILRTWADKLGDLDIDLLLLEVMKKLGSPDLVKTSEEIHDKYPGNPVVTAEMGQILVNSGKHRDGLTLLKRAKSTIKLNFDQQAAYLQGLVHWNYQDFNFQPELTRRDLLEAFEIIDQLKLEYKEKCFDPLIEAETLLAAGEYDAALEMFTGLLRRENGNVLDWTIRRNAGLALSAKHIGNHDVAEAAIREAQDLAPDFKGLKRLAVEIYAQAENLDMVQKLGSTLYAESAEDPKVVSWYADMLRKAGEEQRAEIIISKAIARNPHNLSLVLDLAEPRWLAGDLDKAQKGLDAVTPLLDQANASRDLLRAARGFNAVGDQSNVLDCLRKAANLGGADGVLSLAGHYRMRGELDKCEETLVQLDNNDGIQKFLLAELMSISGKTAEALGLLEDVGDSDLHEDLIDWFFPEDWKNLMAAQSPVLQLMVLLLAREGNFSEALKKTNDWLASHPASFDIRAAAVESAIGASRSEEVKKMLEFEPNALKDPSAAYYRMMWNEAVLERHDLASVKVSAEGKENEDVSIFDRMTNIRLNHLGGDIINAEDEIDWIIQNRSLIDQLSFLQKSSLLRNLVKAAMELCRWGDVLDLVRDSIAFLPKHQGFLNLAFHALVTGLEYKNRFSDLSMTTHAIPSVKLEQMESLFTSLLKSIEDSQMTGQEKWILRGKMALKPEQAFIRQLATYKPEPEDAAAMMSALRRSGQADVAIKIARKFKDNSDVLFELALAEGEVFKSIEAIEGILTIDPENPKAYMKLGAHLLVTGNKADAINAVEAALSFWPNEAEWHSMAAEQWLDLGNYDKQIEHLRSALKLLPENVDCHARLGKALVAVHDLDEGLEHLKFAASQDPNQSDTWIAIAEAHEAAGDTGEALVAAEKAAECSPFSSVPHILSARISFGKGDLAAAMSETQKAVEINPEDADGFVFLSRLYMEQGNKPAALQALEKASQSNNAALQTMIRHAQLLREIKGIEASRELLAEFSQRYPENPDLLKYLAEAEVECGNLEYAQSVTRRALELKPEDPELHRLLGKIQDKSGYLDQAALSFSKAIAYNPQDVQGYLELSRTFYQQREYAKAREVLEEGVSHNQRDVQLLLSLANIGKESKDYSLAEAMLRKASEIEPRNLEVHRQLGAVLALNMIQQSQEASVQS